MKKIISALLALMLASLSLIAVSAEMDTGLYVMDYAYRLSDDEFIEINNKLFDIKQLYGFSLYIVSKYQEENTDTESFAESFCERYELGTNSDSYGLVFIDDYDNDSYLLYPYGYTASYFDESVTESICDGIIEAGNDGKGDCDIYRLMITSVDNVLNGALGEELTTSDYTNDESSNYSAPYSGGSQVVDFAELLTPDQEAMLTDKINNIRAKYSFDIVLHTTNNIGDKNIVEYADDFYDYNGYGIGENRDGLLFMLNMSGGVGNRDYYTSTSGYGIVAFTDYAIGDENGVIYQAIIDDLVSEDYYKAFDKYLDCAGDFLEQASKDAPYDVGNTYTTAKDIFTWEAITILIAVVVAAVVVSILKSGMNTAVKKTEATDYIRQGSFNLTRNNDLLIGKHISKTPKSPPPSAGGRSGGSSVHIGGSGGSHGGGGGKF